METYITCNTLYETVTGIVLWKYWPTFLRSQAVRAGAHGLVLSKCVKANLNVCGSLIVAISYGHHHH